MNRFALLPLAALVAAGCVVHTREYVPQPGQEQPPPPPPQVVEPPYVPQPEPQPMPPPPPPPMVRVFYGGQHMIPAAMGGGWCYLSAPHEHDYWPDNLDWYVFNDGYYFWRGPYQFTYYAGHPLPGGGWCFISGYHHHDYFPPQDEHWNWRGNYYVYIGPYTRTRPPPPTYWRTWSPPPP
ncbi:MAG TPA: hypothetical protein VIV59_06205, partial [Anaeromyxobacteraceae bacterium]